MGRSEKKKITKNQILGINANVLSIILLVISVIFIVICILEQGKTSKYANSLYKLEQERIVCDDAIQEFMDGSDLLTMQIEKYVITTDRIYMDAYWNEVYITKSRDKAIERIFDIDITEEEKEKAIASKRESDDLINSERWAMRMISESIGIPVEEMPEDVVNYELSSEEKDLSNEEKKNRAISYIFGPNYVSKKEIIRQNVNDFRNEIADRYNELTITALENTIKNTRYMALGFLLVTLLFFIIIIMFMRLVCYPIMAYSKEISKFKEGTKIVLKEQGTYEIKQFAKAFNYLGEQVYNYTNRLARLGYIDYLTNVPNRASLTEFVDGLINNKKYPLGFIIIDIDNFKHFNDTFGHATGDLVLKEVAKAINSVEINSNHISGRLCGEEFIVAFENATEETMEIIANSVLHNVKSIDYKDVSLSKKKKFSVTVSAGGAIWNGEEGTNFVTLLSHADKGLYISKNNGKDRYTLMK